MEMNVFLLFGLCIVSFFCYGDSAPRWSWGSLANLHKLHQTNKTIELCSIGECVKWTDCPTYATIPKRTKVCSNERWGPWVCCLDRNGASLEHLKTTETSLEELSANNSESARVSIKDALRTEIPVSFQNPVRGSHLNSSEINVIELNQSSSTKLRYVDKPSSEIRKSSITTVDWINVEGISKNEDTNSDFFRRRKSKASPTPSRKSTVNYRGNDYDFNTENRNTKFVQWKTSTHRPWMKPTRESWQRNRPSSTEKKSSTTWSLSTKNPYASSTRKTSTGWKITSPDPWKKKTSTEPKRWTARTTSRFLGKSTTTSQYWNPTPIIEKRSTKIRRTTTTPRSWTVSTKQPNSRDIARSGNKYTPSGEQRTTPNPKNKHSTRSTTPFRRISTEKWSDRRNPSIFTTKSTRSTRSTVLRSTAAFPRRSTTSRGSTTMSILNGRRSSPSIRKPLPDNNIHMCGVRDSNPVLSRESESMIHFPDSVTINTNFRSNIRERTFQRIVGGTEAEPYSWPWVAALYRVSSTGGNRFLSAGSLINEYYVLTAAHVFTAEDLRSSFSSGSARFVAMLGMHTTRKDGYQHDVSSVLPHPEYQRRFYYNDIALLRLEMPVVFSNLVMPVCLPTGPMTDADLMGKRVTVMGWGDESYGGITSRVLKEASFPIVSRRTCNASYVKVASNRFPKGITNNLLCAGDPDGGKDACQGDSGGPLTTIENGRYTQVGIVSFGYRCGDKDYPGVYTRVASYLNWIEENSDCNRHHGYSDDY